jgi:hypothetical protein
MLHDIVLKDTMMSYKKQDKEKFKQEWSTISPISTT